VKFKTDENLPLEAASILREAGFPCETVWDEALSGAADQTIAARIQEEGRILVALDLDFQTFRHTRPTSTSPSSCCGQRHRTKRLLSLTSTDRSRFFASGLQRANCGSCSAIAFAFGKWIESVMPTCRDKSGEPLYGVPANTPSEIVA
jgi:hypothetical protein